MRTVVIRVDVEPVPQPRHRFTVFAGHARPYLPKSHPVHAYKQALKYAAMAAWKGRPSEMPLALDASFVLARPKRLTWKRKPMPRRRAWSLGDSGDVDNFLKSSLDALGNGLVFVSDGQVCDVAARMRMADGGERPHAVLQFWEVDEMMVEGEGVRAVTVVPVA